MKKVSIHTLGCKVNQSESEAVLELFERAGYRPAGNGEAADVYVVNTCTVTSLSDRKSRQMLRRARTANANAVVVAMGCYAQTAPDEVAKIDGVDVVIGTSDRARVVELAERAAAEHVPVSVVADIGSVRDFEELPIATYENRTRAFLKVQEGCDQYCSYCIIPYARGHIRSRRLAEVAAETERLAAQGFREVVLAGIHVASYGRDLGDAGLLDLIRAVHDVAGIDRIRLSSVEPTLFTGPFIQAIAGLPKVCPHFHLSLQSGCDATLARMNRRYTTGQYAAVVAALRAALPDVAVTTDIMVGFPGETDAEFQATRDFVEQIGFADAHVFKYSVRHGTRAERMDGQIAPPVKEARSKEILAVTAKNAEAFRSRYVGKILPVLFEQRHHADERLFEGKTANYLTVTVPSREDLSGRMLNVRLTGTSGDCIAGELQ